MNKIDFTNAAIPPEMMTKLMGHIDGMEEILSFVRALETKESRGMFKSGHFLAPFVDLAYQVSKSHPGILPAVFQTEEFQRQYELSKNLAFIESRVSKLSSAISSTLRILQSQVLENALDIYGAVKVNLTKVPGLVVVMEEMQSFFKKTKIKAKAVMDKIK